MPLDREKIKQLVNNMENEEIPRSPIIDNGNNPFMQIANTFNGNKAISLEDYKKYAKYGVYLNNIDDQETLDKERAKNQSNWEKAGRSLAQIVENEILLGTLKIAGDIVGAIQNIWREERNFSNDYSKFFEDLQNKNKERLEIYRQNPNKSFDIGDFSWWADNFVTVGSTLSLMIPSGGIAKGLSLIGKATNLEYKTAKLLNKVNSISKTGKLISHPNLVARELGYGLNSATQAMLSRTLENYQEAREVYKNSYDETLNSLNNFTNEERQEFINRNPNFTNLNNEEIADKLASEGATKTMRNDYAMLLMDLIEYRALGSLMKGSLKGHSGAKARIAARNEQKRLAGITDAAAFESDRGFNLFKENLKYNFKHPLEGVKFIPWGESIEEGYQGIQSEKGQEVARMALDPTISARTLDSYLTDGSIWEQAFWGVAGGLAFKGAGKGFRAISDKIEEKNAKKGLNETEAARVTNSTQRQINEVNSRVAKLNKFAEDLSHISEGHLPEDRIDRYQTNEDGSIKRTQDGVPVLKELNDYEIEIEKSNALATFMTDFVLDAADANTYDTLQDFINDPSFVKFLSDNGIKEDIIDEYTKVNANELLTSIYDKYVSNLQVVDANISSKDDKIHDYVLRSTARYLTRQDMNIYNLRNRIDSINEVLENSEDYKKNENIEQYIEKVRAGIAASELAKLDSYEDEINDAYTNKEITKAAYEASIKDITDLREQRLAIFNNTKENIEVFNEFNNNYKTLVENISKNVLNQENRNILVKAVVKDLQNSILKDSKNKNVNPVIGDNTRKLIEQKIYNELSLAQQEGIVSMSKDDYISLYKELHLGIDKYTTNRFNEAIDTVTNYLEKSKDLDKAWLDIFDNQVQDEKVKNALDILKLGYYGTQNAYKLILNTKAQIEADRVKKAKDGVQPIVDGEKKTGEVGKAIADKFNAKVDESEGIKPPSSSTGETPKNNPDEVPMQPEFEGEKVKDLNEDQPSPISNDEISAIEQLNVYYARNSKSILSFINKIQKIDFSDENFKELYDQLKGVLLDKNAGEYALNKIKELLSLRAYKTKDEHFISLCHQLSNDTIVKLASEDSDKASYTVIENKEERNALIEQLLNTYAEITNITRNSDGSINISLDNFFNYLMTDRNIDINTVRRVFSSIENYIAENKFNNINFIDKQNFTSYKSNPDQFFVDLAESKQIIEELTPYTHVGITNESTSDKIIKLIDSHFRNKEKHPVIASIKKLSDKKSNISITIDGQEIGYLTIPTVNKDGKLITVNKLAGFNYQLETDNNGNIITNFDNLFNQLINEELKGYGQLYKAIRSAGNEILDLDIIKELIDNNSITLGTWELNDDDSWEYTTITDKGQIAGLIKNELKNILNYRDSQIEKAYMLNVKDGLTTSINQWKQRLLKNYQFTYDLYQRLQKDNRIKVDINAYRVQKPNFDDKEHSLHDTFIANKPGIKVTKEKGQAYIDNALIGIGSGGIAYSEDGRPFNPTPFTAGTMGFLLHTADGYPIIAPFSSANKFFTIDDKTGARNYGKIGKAISEHLTQTITAWTNNKITFEELADNFEQLFGTKSKNGTSNPLTYGLRVIKMTNGIGIVDTIHKDSDNKEKYVAVIYNKKHKIIDDKVDKTSWVDTTAFNIFSDKTGAPLRYVNEDGSTASPETKSLGRINFMVEHLMNHITYNHSFYALQNVDNPTPEKINKYFYKENGKFHVHFEDPTVANKSITYTYDTFGQFLLENNAFNTFIKPTSDNSRYTIVDNDWKQKGIYMRISDKQDATEVSAVSDKLNVEKGISEIKKATEDKPVEGESILRAFGFNEDVINTLTTPITDAHGHSATLIPTKLYYINKDTPYDAIRQKSSDKVYITKRGIKAIHGRDDAGIELTRLLLHEQLHNSIYRSGRIKTENAINELIDTYNQFAEYINRTDIPMTTDIVMARDFIEHNNFTLKDFKLVEGVDEKKRRDVFAEEWAVESFTRPELARILNNIEYKGNIKETKESLWQKIIKAILKFLGLDIENLNKNSILAKQYSIFGNKSTKNLITRITNDNNETFIQDNGTLTPPVKQEQEEEEEELLDYDDFGAVEPMASSTQIGITAKEAELNLFDENDNVNPNGFIKVENMKSAFINKFPDDIKPIIAKMVDNGELEYICQ